jgi:hypothetical protein
MDTMSAGSSKFLGLLAQDFQKQYGLREPYSYLFDGLDIKGQVVGREPVHQALYLGSQKHPFLSPPATLNIKDGLYQLVQDTLRGQTVASLPFFDRKKIISALDELSTLDEGTQVAYDLVLMSAFSLCVLQERYKLAAPVH